MKNKTAPIIAGAMAVVGLIAGVATMAGAQSVSTTSSSSTAITSTQPSTQEQHGHAPLGGDGVISSINGTTIVVSEEADEGGASYTIDASKATITNKGGATATLADLKIGDKIFVQGAVNGTSVSATSISLGHPERVGKEANDTDGSSQSEANEGTSTSDASDN